MRKLMAVILTLALVVCAPWALADEMTLEELTLSVKQLFEISDDYTDFSSDFYDGFWNLNWYKDDKQLSVNCDKNGIIYSYWVYENSTPYTNDLTGRFPTHDAESVLKAANEFLAKVINDGNGWELDDYTESLNNEYSIYVSGRLTINDYPTDIYISVSLNPKTLEAESYYRGDQYTRYGNAPVVPELALDDDAARALLDATNVFTLKYIVANYGDMAKLCYVANTDSTYIVRASDGAVLDAYALYKQADATAYAMSEGDSGGGDAYDVAERFALTETELEGISVYDDALPMAELDAQLRGMEELEIDESYELTSAEYYGSAADLTASLTYSKEANADDLATAFGCSIDEAEQMISYGDKYYFAKSASLDAMTGMLRSYNYSEPYSYDYVARQAAPKNTDGVAEEFVKKYYPDIYPDVVFDKEGTENTYNGKRVEYTRFTRVYDGYMFDDHYIYFSVDAVSGSIMGIYTTWDFGQEFEEVDAQQIISMEAAANAYNETLESELAYVSVPVQRGYNGDVHEYTLAWHYKSNGSAFAVDAVTGEVMRYSYEEGEIHYDDIAGDPNESEILMLAKYGVGFDGGMFYPDEPLYVYDAVELILQANGYNVFTWEYSSMLSSLSYMGVNYAGQYNPYDELDGITFAKLLIDASGFGRAAKIPGIFACDFADREDIAAQDTGYAVIAHALGLLSTDAQGAINAYAPLTRSDGALMIYNFLDREY